MARISHVFVTLQRILFQHYFEERMHDAQKNINQRSILYKPYVANKRHTFHEVYND